MIAYSFGHNECTKVSGEVVYCCNCLLRITYHKATLSPNFLAHLIKKTLLMYKITLKNVKIIIKPNNKLINWLWEADNRLCTFGPGHSSNYNHVCMC